MQVADKFQIHYYLANESHAMNAFVRNKCEAELLAIFQEVCTTLGTSFAIESLPYEEGGLREWWKAYGENSVQINTTLTILAVIISALALSRSPVSDPERDARDRVIQELTIEEKKLIIEKLKKEMGEGKPSQETIERAAKATEKNLKIQTRRSNFYKHLNAYEKATQVGFSVLDIQNQEVVSERLVARADFTKYILFDNNLPTEIIEGAWIEIVAPVLKEGNYKWRGIYDGEAISFSMKDVEFKNSVLQERVTFQHGSQINCVLHIHRKFNEIGEVEVTGWSVITVLDKADSGGTTETPQGKKYRAYKKFQKDQQTLF